MQYADWRWIFLINLPIAALTVFIAVRAVPETRDPNASVHFDIPGAVLASAALAATLATRSSLWRRKAPIAPPNARPRSGGLKKSSRNWMTRSLRIGIAGRGSCMRA